MKMQLKTYVQVEDLQNQLAAYLGSQVRSRGFMPTEAGQVLFLDIAPAIATERLIDAVFKSGAAVNLARQGGLLELHAEDPAELAKVADLLMKLSGTDVKDAEQPIVGTVELIEEISARHAIMLNASYRGSMLTPGESLLICEVSPAPFAVLLANEVEKVVPEIILVDIQEVGGHGRLSLAGTKAQLESARKQIDKS